jgi:phage-related protein
VKKLSPQLRRQARQLDATRPWLWLFDVDVNGAEHLLCVAGHEPVTYDGQTFAPYPIAIGQLTSDTEGTLAVVEAVALDYQRELSRYMRANNRFRGRPVRVRLVHAEHLLEPAAIDVTLRILNSSRQRERRTVTFRIGMSPLMDYPFPRHRYLRGRCRHIYKGPFCGYEGDMPTCDKTLTGADGCEAHDNVARYGGQPGIRRR